MTVCGRRGTSKVSRLYAAWRIGLIAFGIASVQFSQIGEAHARVQRSQSARVEFKKLHPCPSTGRPSGACPGWIIDHVKPLACGGADHFSNMQWQTTAEAKAKDRWERMGCPSQKK